MQTRHLPETSDQTRWAMWLTILAGLWVLISPWVLGYSTTSAATTSDVVIGIVIAVLAAIRAWWAPAQVWLTWIDVILGIWLLISPWVLGFTHVNAPLWNNVIFGIVVIVLAGWSSLNMANRPTTVA